LGNPLVIYILLLKQNWNLYPTDISGPCLLHRKPLLLQVKESEKNWLMQSTTNQWWAGWYFSWFDLLALHTTQGPRYLVWKILRTLRIQLNSLVLSSIISLISNLVRWNFRIFCHFQRIKQGFLKQSNFRKRYRVFFHWKTFY